MSGRKVDVLQELFESLAQTTAALEAAYTEHPWAFSPETGERTRRALKRSRAIAATLVMPKIQTEPSEDHWLAGPGSPTDVDPTP